MDGADSIGFPWSRASSVLALLALVACGRVDFDEVAHDGALIDAPAERPDAANDGRVEMDSAAPPVDAPVLTEDSPPQEGGPIDELVVGSCGDGVVAGAEECDDGNGSPGDGCSATCRLEDQGAGGESCTTARALALVPIAGGRVGAVASGDTTGASDNSSSGCGGSPGPDHIYSVTLLSPEAQLYVTVSPGPTYDVMVAIHDNVCATSGTLCCAGTGGPGFSEAYAACVVGAGTFMIVVDADTATDQAGLYTVRVESTAP